LWVRTIPWKGRNANEYMKDHIFELRRKIHSWLITSVKTHNLNSC